VRACEIPDFPVTRIDADGSISHCTPSNKQRNTSR
jgi:hypothetical protein